MPVVVRRVVIPLDGPCEQARLKRSASVLVATRYLPVLLALSSSSSTASCLCCTNLPLLLSLLFPKAPGLGTLLGYSSALSSKAYCLCLTKLPLLLSLRTLLFSKTLSLSAPGFFFSPFFRSLVPLLLSSSALTAQCAHLKKGRRL